MRTAALVIGIDDYSTRPLSSAVNDAEAFKKTLLDLNLVEKKDIYLMTAPQGQSQELPNRNTISKKLHEYYLQSDLDRFYFFFAGHGISAYSDISHSRLCTALIPRDLSDLKIEGNMLINVEEILDRFCLAGPKEQFYFIDACRDLDYELLPTVGPLGWMGQPIPGLLRSQSVLFAVKPLGKAEGVKGELGRMTSFLLEALRDDKIAVEYNDALGKWVISIHSIADYVSKKLKETFADQPQWKRKYNLPHFIPPSQPQNGILRVLESVPQTDFVINILPEEIEKDTNIDVFLRGARQDPLCFPPQKSGMEFQLLPQCYRMEAKNEAVPITPKEVTIDARLQYNQVFTIPAGTEAEFIGGPGFGFAPEISTEPRFEERSASRAKISEVSEDSLKNTNMGLITTDYLEPYISIELKSKENVEKTWISRGKLEQKVPAGAYEILFKLGEEIYDQTEVYVKPGTRINIQPTIQMTPLLSEALEIKPENAPRVTYISESIGPLQSGILETMLPLIGVKAFDTRREMLHQFDDIVEPHAPEEFNLKSLSLVIAVDGYNWPVSINQVLESLSARLTVITNENSRKRTIALPLKTLRRTTLSGGYEDGEEGLNRIRLAMIEAPADNYWLEFESPYIGSYRLACAAIDRRATVITIILNPDGQIEISQNILRFPYRDELYPNEHFVPYNYGRVVRDLQLGQKLFSSGELVEIEIQSVIELLYAKWTDPILSCIGYHAIQNGIEIGKVNAYDWENPCIRTSENLMRFFHSVPDSRVIFGDVVFKYPHYINYDSHLPISRDASRDQIYYDLLESEIVPVLASSTKLLAGYALQKGFEDNPIVDIAQRLSVETIWTINSL